MKTMTCKQLHGPCDALIHGETAKEMMASGDVLHIETMNAMKKQRIDMDPQAVKQFMNKFQNNFAAQPEDK